MHIKNDLEKGSTNMDVKSYKSVCPSLLIPPCVFFSREPSAS